MEVAVKKVVIVSKLAGFILSCPEVKWSRG